ncbi:MAG TPA: cytochrome c biogenesis protein ResB [Candidatus Sulfotelmatobacter sp.]|nr:cytochrome c biogenesis protein ResB [Candidatus Sulfotelmatobacter sp.]
MFIQKTVKVFTSLKLTVTLLAFSIVLVFVGTIAQADEGLYGAQAHYFKQWIVVGANFFGHKIPILLPGGYLLGVLLLVNLVCGHIYRFELTWKKIGIQLAHAGVIVLLVGQLATDMLARELQMEFSEGESRNYSQSSADYELAVVNGTEVTAVPARLLKVGDELKISSLPFAIRVKEFWKNSEISFRPPMMTNLPPPLVNNGVARDFNFVDAAEEKSPDKRNIPTAIIELLGDKNSYGDWVVSGWSGDESMIADVQQHYVEDYGPMLGHSIATRLTTPQSVTIDDHTFTLLMQPVRVRHPFSLTLLKATHTVYPGTDIPKDFRSRVRVENPQTGENREVEISMNHPLRYGGYTFYQYQMSAGQLVEQAGQIPYSVLQVVRNPSWLTPYIGCGMVGVGLMIQFLFHLVKFVSKQKPK